MPTTGACAMAALATNTACDDNNACTTGDFCKDGACASGTDTCFCTADTDCSGQDDGDQCNGMLFCNKTNGKCELNPASVVKCPTVDDSACLKNRCQPKSGKCAPTPSAVGTPCEDGNACTKSTFCSGGLCTGGTSVCACQTNADCEVEDDGNKCNGTFFCDKTDAKPACVFNKASVVTCKATDASCLTNVCNPANGACQLQASDEDSSCPDGGKCVVAATCKKGVCTGKKLVCDDGDACTFDSCEPKSGCVYEAKTCADGNDCTDATCDKKTGVCQFGTAALQDKGCNADNDGCTVNDSCDKGACKAGTAVVCKNKTAACEAAVCVKKSALGFECVVVPKTDGAVCDDNDPCTLTSSCQKGECKRGAKETYFIHAIQPKTGKNGRLEAVALRNDGNWTAAGTTWNGAASNPADAKIWVVIYTKGGGKLFEAEYGATKTHKWTSVAKVFQLGTDHTIVVGTAAGPKGDSNLHLAVLHPNGSALFQKQAGYDDLDERALDAVLIGGNEGVVFGSSGKEGARKPLIVKVNTLGTVLWTAVVPSIGDSEARGGAEYKGGKLVAVGTQGVPSDHKLRHGWVGMLTAQGGLLWQRPVVEGSTSDLRRVAVMPNGDLMATGSVQLLDGRHLLIVRLASDGSRKGSIHAPIFGRVNDIVARGTERLMLAVGQSATASNTLTGALIGANTDFNVQIIRSVGAVEGIGTDTEMLAIQGSTTTRLALAGQRQVGAKTFGLLWSGDAFGHYHCESSGPCGGKTWQECDDGNPCTVDDCDDQKGCANPAGPGFVCDFDDGCHVGGRCDASKCGPSANDKLFEKNYVVGDWGKPASTFALQDGGNFITGQGPSAKWLMMRTDAAGKQVWLREFAYAKGQQDRTAVAGVETSGGGLAVIGTLHLQAQPEARVSGLDAGGETLWQWPAFGTSEYGTAEDLVVAAGGGSVLATWSNNGKIGVARVGADGKKVWANTVSLAIAKTGGDVSTAAMADGGLLVAAASTPAGAATSQLGIARVNPIGLPLWTKHIAAGGAVALKGFDQAGSSAFVGTGAVVAGNKQTVPWLFAVNTSGQVVWQRLGATDFVADAVDVAADGTLWLAGQRVVDGVAKLAVASASKDGAILWQRSYAPAGNKVERRNGRLITAKPDGFSVATSAFDGNQESVYLVRGDADGNTSCASAGTCAKNLTGACDDSDPCTIDSCDPTAKTKGGCVHKAAAASEGMACGEQAFCLLGNCKAAPHGSVPIPAGDFAFGCNLALDTNCEKDEKPQLLAKMSAYWIQRDEVLLSDYKKCLAAGKCAARDSNSVCAQAADSPVNCITHLMAVKYCAFVGGSLPTEAQWEKAARGGCEHATGDCLATARIHPWGNAPATCDYTVRSTETKSGFACGLNKVPPPGSKVLDTSPYGVRDMAGSMREWTSEFYTASLSKHGTDDPVAPATTGGRVIKGRSWRDGFVIDFRLSTRHGMSGSSVQHSSTGIRCVFPAK